MEKIKGFTLAEVLITLTILGVVAAIAIPSLVNNQKKKELESKFKVATAAINEAYDRMIIENPKKDFSYYKNCNISCSKEFQDNFFEYFKAAKSYDGRNGLSRIPDYNGYELLSFNGKASSPSIEPCGGSPVLLQMFSNIAVGTLINCSTIYISLDTNGIKKAPNRWGYDTFLFKVTDKGVIPYNGTWGNNYKDIKCNKTDTTAQNGYGCSMYALKNQCPWDSTKKYWECLEF